jgi:hypothetical protein
MTVRAQAKPTVSLPQCNVSINVNGAANNVYGNIHITD